MILNELYSREPLVEWGVHRFPGFGRALFTQQHFEYVASQIANIPDDVLRVDLGTWFENAFDRDGSNFKSGKFMDWVRENKRGGRGSATFQQRHFYYFAHLIKMESDPHRREFLTDWLAEMFRQCNESFKKELWIKNCTPQPLNEGPAYGSKGFPGFGQKLFGGPHRSAIGKVASEIADPVVRREIGVWFGKAFIRDEPNTPGYPPRFKEEAFVEAVSNRGEFRSGSPRFQMRHYYYLAQLIQDESDVHMKVFLCHLLTPVFMRNNEHFIPSRWEDFCKIPAEHRDWKPENYKKNDKPKSQRVEDED